MKRREELIQKLTSWIGCSATVTAIFRSYIEAKVEYIASDDNLASAIWVFIFTFILYMAVIILVSTLMRCIGAIADNTENTYTETVKTRKLLEILVEHFEVPEGTANTPAKSGDANTENKKQKKFPMFRLKSNR